MDKWFKKFIGCWYATTGILFYLLAYSYPKYAIVLYAMFGSVMIGWGINKIYEILFVDEQ